MRRRALLVILLVLVLALGAAACGGGDEGDGETDAADTGSLFPSETGAVEEEPPAEEPAGDAPLQIAVPAPGESVGPQSPADDVIEVQKALRELGFKVGKPDGIYGGRTRRAVERFQKQHKLEQDGLIGPRTARAINKELRQQAREN
jgi:peptidoglycan hydrolase-like protein with peptidoglycan-binding domain